MSLGRLLAAACLALGLGCDPPARDRSRYACTLAPNNTASTATHPRADRHAAALRDAVAGRLPGAVLFVHDADGIWVGAEGSADLDLDVALQPCHRTRIASVTKMLVATVVLRLAARGIVDLDRPWGPQAPPSIASRFEAADRVTVRQLLQHTSGYADYSGVPWGIELFNDPERTFTRDDVLDRAAKLDRLFDAPGRRHEYANTNYVLLGTVIDHATGRSHADILREEVFEPAGMASASYDPDRFEFDGVVRGYLDLYGDRALVDATETYAINTAGPQGAVAATASDVGFALDALFREHTLLDEDSRAAMMSWIEYDGLRGFDAYGLGLERWTTDFGPAVGHIGQEFGYLTFAFYFLEHDVTFVLWINASSIAEPTDANLTGEIVDVILLDLVDAALG